MANALDFALSTARQAGQLLRDHYHQKHIVQHKSSRIDLVTEADLASERLIVGAMRGRFPDHAILSEEGLGDLSEMAGETPNLWVVDPLDGTINYAHGYPVWGLSIAHVEHGRVVLAVCYDPLRDEIFWAERGQGAWCNGQRMRVSGTVRLQDALVATGFAYKRATLVDNNLAEFCAIMPRVQGVRRGGAAVLDLAHLADGRLDAYWEMHLNPWDWAAGYLLIQEAGGNMTDMHGEPWLLESNHTAASNGVLHDELLEILCRSRHGYASFSESDPENPSEGEP
jgi:myo-inositol-1(or 4)-monophosphatase